MPRFAIWDGSRPQEKSRLVLWRGRLFAGGRRISRRPSLPGRWIHARLPGFAGATGLFCPAARPEAENLPAVHARSVLDRYEATLVPPISPRQPFVATARLAKG